VIVFAAPRGEALNRAAVSIPGRTAPGAFVYRAQDAEGAGSSVSFCAPAAALKVDIRRRWTPPPGTASPFLSHGWTAVPEARIHSVARAISSSLVPAS
jgi:hypothetical protein